jgi:hypothetical protein
MIAGTYNFCLDMLFTNNSRQLYRSSSVVVRDIDDISWHVRT